MTETNISIKEKTEVPEYEFITTVFPDENSETHIADMLNDDYLIYEAGTFIRDHSSTVTFYRVKQERKQEE